MRRDGHVVVSPGRRCSGTFTGTISGSDVTGWASGAYTIAGEEGSPLTLTQQGPGCIDGIPNSCRDTTEGITRTSTD